MAAAVGGFATWVASFAGGTATFWGAVTYGVAYVGATAAIAYGAAELAKPETSEAVDPGSQLQLKADANYPREIIVGTRATGGSLAYFNLSGNKNTVLHYVIALADHRCSKLKRVWIDGGDPQDLTLTHGQTATLTRFGTGDTARCWVTFYDGRFDQTHDTGLAAVSGGKWTSNHRLRGVSYVIVKMQYDPERLRAPPSFIWEVEGAKLYDRRLDTTAGGSGSHRMDDETTWAYSENPEVFWDHYRQGIYRDGKLWWGMGRPADEVPYAEFAARANLCDEDVDLLAGGTQKRYRLNGIISASETHAAVAGDVAKAMGGRVIDIGGRVRILAGGAQSPVMTLTDDDIIAGTPLVYTSRVGFDELVNRVEATYVNPDETYAEVGISPIESATYLAADGDVEHTATPHFRFETNEIRCQRLATLHLEDARLQGKLRATFPLAACQIEPGDWFTMESVRLGFPSGKDFLVLSRTLNADLTVDIFAVETDASVSAWDENDEVELSISTPPEYEFEALEIPALTVTAFLLTGVAAEIPAIEITWDAPDDPRVQQILIEAVPSGGKRTALVIDVATGAVVLEAGIADAVLYSVKARFLAGELRSDWSDVETVTTDTTYNVGTSDIAGSITGQGWGATASEAAASNLAANKLPDNFLNFPHEWTAANAGSPTTAANVSGWTRTGARISRTLSGANFHYVMAKALIPNVSGEKYKIKLHWRFSTLPSAAAGTNAISLFFRTQNTSHTYVTVKALVNGVVPSSTAVQTTETEWTGDGVDAWLRPGGYVRSDITNGTIEFLGFEFYTPATGWTKLSDIADGADVTADNTASGIAGQGTQATANSQRGATYTGTPVEGSWWADTSTNQLKYYTLGAWTVVSTIANTLVATISDTEAANNFANQGTPSSTPSVTVTAEGGTAPYAYKWRNVTVGSNELTASAASSATTYWTGTVTGADDITEEWECVVTDANNASAFVRCTAVIVDSNWEG